MPASATAATTCGAAVSPATASASRIRRSRGVELRQRRRTTPVIGGPSKFEEQTALGPCSASSRPSSPSSHGLPATTRRQSAAMSSGVPGASRSISVRRPRRSAAAGAARSPNGPRRAGSGDPPPHPGRRRARRPPAGAGHPRCAPRGRPGPPASAGRPSGRRRRRAPAGAFGERGAEPEHAVGDERRRVRARRRPFQSNSPAVAATPSSARRVPRRTPRGAALEQRADDPEGEVALQRPRRGAADTVSGTRGELGRLIQERGLAQPRGRVEHDDRAAPGGEPGDAVGEHVELVRARSISVAGAAGAPTTFSSTVTSAARTGAYGSRRRATACSASAAARRGLRGRSGRGSGDGAFSRRSVASAARNMAMMLLCTGSLSGSGSG